MRGSIVLFNLKRRNSLESRVHTNLQIYLPWALSYSIVTSMTSLASAVGIVVFVALTVILEATVLSRCRSMLSQLWFPDPVSSCVSYLVQEGRYGTETSDSLISSGRNKKNHVGCLAQSSINLGLSSVTQGIVGQARANCMFFSHQR